MHNHLFRVMAASALASAILAQGAGPSQAVDTKRECSTDSSVSFETCVVGRYVVADDAYGVEISRLIAFKFWISREDKVTTVRPTRLSLLMGAYGVCWDPFKGTTCGLVGSKLAVTVERPVVGQRYKYRASDLRPSIAGTWVKTGMNTAHVCANATLTVQRYSARWQDSTDNVCKGSLAIG